MNTRTKLDQLCEGVIEAGWLAALVVAPMFFNVFSSRVFEPDKISLVRTIALVMAVAWLMKIANAGYAFLPAYGGDGTIGEDKSKGWDKLWRNPFFIPVTLLIIAYLLSTATSLAPFVSLFGSYQRLQGTYSFLAYVIIGLITAASLRSPAQIRRLQHVIVVTSLPIAIYGVVQHYDIDPLPWGGNVTTRVAGNAGNAIFLAAYLIMAFFLTAERIYSSFAALISARGENARGADTVTALAGGAYLFIAMVQLLAIFWTQSRGPWLGILFGFYIFVLLILTGLRVRWYRGLTIAWIGLGLAAALVLLLMNTTSYFDFLRPIPYVGRLTQLLDEDSNTAKVRFYIWQGAQEMSVPHEPLAFPDGSTDRFNFIRPLVGYGPEAMWVAYNRFYQPELAHVEQRNASPDRSHNETWDSLVITGGLGFIAYLAVFISIFYWSLHWLGLLINRRDKLLFFGLLALCGVGITAYFVNANGWHLFGVALPAGMMLGLGIYITLTVFLHGDVSVEQRDIPRQLLIIALLTAIVAHFVEIHFGIAIGATRTYFWIYTAILTTLGLRWSLAQPMAAAVETAQSATEPEPEPLPATPVIIGKRKAGATGTKTKPVVAAKTAPARRIRSSETLPLLPLTILTDVLIFLTAVFIYTTNSAGLTNAATILIRSVTQRAEGGASVSSPAILFLLIFTWLIAALLGLGMEALRLQRIPPASWWLRVFCLHDAIVWGAWFFYGLIQGSRLAPVTIPAGLSPNEQLQYQLDHIAGHFAFFTGVLIVWLLVAGVVYAWPALRDRKLSFATRPIVSLTVGAVATALALVLINTVNIALVRADIIYKQGQQFDSQRNWVNSIELYRRALDARKTEDHYMLFLGRALLEQAKVTQAAEGTVDFPAEPTLDDVLDLRPETVAQMGRLELLRSAEAVLTEAQRVNPLNTDHTANLSRLYRTWADLTTDNPEMRQEMLEKSVEEYTMAVTLSPNSAHLWNERGNAHLALGQRDEAEKAYLRSLELDQLFDQTYLLLADFYEGSQEYEKAAEVLRKGIATLEAQRGRGGALQLDNYLTVALARSGDITGAIQATEKIVEIQPGDITAARNLALLYRDNGNLTEAARWISQTLAGTPPDSAELSQLRNTAVDIYQQLLADNPQDYQTAASMARLLQALGNTEAARGYATMALQSAPESEKAAIEQLIQSLGG